MAVSGSYDFNRTRNELIYGALRCINVLASGETPTDNEIADASEALNMMIKNWEAEGVGIWLLQECTLLLQADQVKYVIGPSSTSNHWSASVTKTEVATAAAAAATDIVVDSVTGLTAADTIGIETTNDDIHWDTISSIASTTVTITTGLDYATAVDNHVYAYTSRAQRPLQIVECRLIDENDNERPISIVSWPEYQSLSDKTSEGSPSQVCYLPTLTDGTLYVWQEPNDMKKRLEMTIKRPIADFDGCADNAEFPPEWLEAIKFSLAIRLAPEYGKSVSDLLIALAANAKVSASQLDREMASVYMQPDTEG